MTASEQSDPLRCRNCAARLAHDQRYCLHCGTRRGALPRPVAELLGAMLESGAKPKVQPPRVAEPAWTFTPKLPFGFTLPSPRAAAVGVMGMMAFGVIVGTSERPSWETLSANAPLLLAVSPHSNGSAATRGASGPLSTSDTSGGGGGTTQVVTVIQTTPAPSSPAGGGSAPQSPAVAAPTAPAPGNSTIPNPLGLPPIHHVFLIMLSNQPFNQTFGLGSGNAYFSKTLPSRGKLLEYYYGVAGSELANANAVISGQGPTEATAVNCPEFTAIPAGHKRAHNEVIGQGCVYPAKTQTLADQLTAKGLSWKAYVEGVDYGPPGQPTTCRHAPLGKSDPYHAPRDGDPYVTWRNPFVYFRSLNKSCVKNDVGLDKLVADLKSPSKAPTFAYIAPGPCDNGSPQPCTPGAQSGLASAENFLKTVVPEIQQSAAYQDNGLIAITFDQAPQSGQGADSTACCHNPKYPNLPPGGNSTSTTQTGTGTLPGGSTSTTTPGVTTSTSPTTTSTTTTSTTPSNTGSGQTTPTGGGGQVGMLLISSFVKKGSVDLFNYFDHYSLLASIEDMFQLKRLGYGADRALPVFDKTLFIGGG